MTARPLRIAFLGWARLSLQAREGSGYNLSASELAAGLAMSGHSVFYMRSGMDYSVSRTMHARPFETWRGVACYDFFNSPNLSPASSNFNNMPAEIAAPDQCREVLRWLDAIGAQVVHIHSLEGYPLDLIAAIRRTGRPVVITPHNYWYACPQVDLLHRETSVCMDYEGGARCVGCLEAPRPPRARLRRSLEQSAFRAVGPFWGHTLRNTYFHLKHHIKLAIKPAPPVPPTTTNAAPDTTSDTQSSTATNLAAAGLTVDPELALPYEAAQSPDHPGTVDHRLRVEPAEIPPRLGESPLDQNERFLSSDRHLVVLNDYGRRRVAGIAALNQASLVTPPSRFLMEAMCVMGLDRDKARHVRLGQPHFDQVNRATRRSPYYRVRPWNPRTATQPLRFAFLGTTRNNKGLDVLARAIPLLDKSVRQSCRFMLRAAGWDWVFRKRLSQYPEVSFLGGYDTLHLVAALGEFEVGILPHVWFENSPLVLLEFLHAGRFVISSRLGGPPEWLVEPGASAEHPLGNGLLFPGGSSEALAACITRVVTGDVTIPSPAEVHAVSTLHSYPDHVRDVDAIYQSLLTSGAPRPDPAAIDQFDPRPPAPHTGAPARNGHSASVNGSVANHDDSPAPDHSRPPNGRATHQ